MNFDYDFLLDVYEAMFANQVVFSVVTGLKFIAVCMVILDWYGKYFGFTKDQKQNALPVTPYDVLKGFGFIFLIGFYDQLLGVLDTMMASVENYYKVFEVRPKDMGLETPEDIPQQDQKDWTDTLKDAAHYFSKILQDPTYTLVQLAKAIAWFIDLMIFGVFLAERFFFLGILRILGAIALAFSFHPKLGKWFWNWLGLYFAIWLLIIPYFLVNAFTNIIYEKSEQVILSMMGGMLMPGAYTPLVVVVLFIIWVKFKLYKGSRDIVYKIFN